MKLLNGPLSSFFLFSAVQPVQPFTSWGNPDVERSGNDSEK
jgi:hypothetical protein